MTKDSLNTFIVSSPDASFRLEATFLKTSFNQPERIKFRYPVFFGLILNVTGELMIEQGASRLPLVNERYQLLFTIGGWATTILSPGHHELLFISLPSEFLSLFEGDYPEAVAEYNRARAGWKTYSAFNEPQPMAPSMRRLASMIFEIDISEAQNRQYFLYQMAVSLFLEHLQRVPRNLQLNQPKKQLIGVAHHAQYLLETQYSRAWTIEMLSDEVGIHKKTLTRKFRATFATTPMQYLIDTRLKIAHDMIATSEASISIISGRVGYKHIGDFTRAFQKRFGCPPTHARARYFPKS